MPKSILSDYDRHHFDIEQMERLKKHPAIFKIVWFVERLYFKIDKWKIKYWSWKR